MACPGCDMQISGEFGFPRLLRLSGKNLVLAEALILAGGNLKSLAQTLGISYPTVRKRVDDLIDELETLRAEDQRRVDAILRDVAAGKLNAAKGTRLIKELNGAE